MTILSDGAVYACRRMESKVGNALTEDLYDLFTSSKYDAFRQYEKFKKCAKCELLRFCRGCPAVAYGYSLSETGETVRKLSDYPVSTYHMFAH